MLNINLGYDWNLYGQIYLPVFPQRISWHIIFPIWQQKSAFLLRLRAVCIPVILRLLQTAVFRRCLLPELPAPNVAPIHCRYDVKEVMSMEQLQRDIDFLVKFTRALCKCSCMPGCKGDSGED